MKLLKKTMIIILVCSIMISTISTATHASEPIQINTIKDYLAYQFQINDLFDTIEESYDTDLTQLKNDIFALEGIDSNWQDEAVQLLEDYNVEHVSALSRAADTGPSTQHIAKADAITYSVDRAIRSYSRNPNIDFEKECLYMFLSHYVDRNDYYWATLDERKLMDGSTQSGANGLLADYLQDGDRSTYDAYMKVSTTLKDIEHIGKIGLGIKDLFDSGTDVTEAFETISRNGHSSREFIRYLGADATLAMSAEDAKSLWEEDIIPLAEMYLERSAAGNPSLEAFKNYYMNDEGLRPYTEIDKEELVMTVLGIIASVALTGPGALLGTIATTIVGAAVNFSFGVYMNFFDYAAWVTMRYTFSMRYAERLRVYIWNY